MRPIWKGAVSFGLVSIPVSLYGATENKDVRFHQLHRSDGSRIAYKKFCADEDREVSNDDIIRGYEYARGQYVTVEDTDLDKIPLSTMRAIEIIEFVDLPEVDPIFFEKAYYLEPQSGAAKPYALLREAMARANKIAIAKVSLRDKEHLAIVRAYENVLVMETLFYPDEIRSTDQLEQVKGEYKVTDKELAMAINLIEALAAEFDPGKFKDSYREALMDLIDQKIQGKPIEAPRAKPSAKVMDLMEALRASVEMAKTPAEMAPAKRKKKVA